MKEFINKTAFITGGASGIGLGIAKTLLKEGMNVVIGDVQDDRLDRAEAELKAISNNIMAVNVDVCSRSALQEVAEMIERRFGTLQVLCNNAGIGGGAKVLETPDERWRRVQEVNLWGPINGIKVFLPRMLESGEECHIVNTSSFSGIHGHGNQSCYGASKFALVGLSEFLRNDLTDTEVSVSVLCPHVADTPIIDALKEKVNDQVREMIEDMAVPADTVGQQVLNAIKNQEFYIFCDGTHTRKMLEKRCEDMLAAMDRQFPKEEG